MLNKKISILCVLMSVTLCTISGCSGETETIVGDTYSYQAPYAGSSIASSSSIPSSTSDIQSSQSQDSISSTISESETSKTSEEAPSAVESTTENNNEISRTIEESSYNSQASAVVVIPSDEPEESSYIPEDISVANESSEESNSFENTFKNEFINALLENEETWAWKYDMSREHTTIAFEDLDLDGNLELVRTQETQGSGLMTYSEIFTYKNANLIDAGTIHGFYTLYKGTSSDLAIFSSEKTRGGNGYYSECNYKYIYNYESNDETILSGGGIALHTTQVKNANDIEEKYFKEIFDNPYEREEISESEYNTILDNSKTGYKIVVYDTNKYSGSDWLKLSANQKRQVLIDLYDSYKLK